MEWLSNKLATTPTILEEHTSDLTLNIFTRTITDKNGNLIYLTSKEFDLLYFLYSRKGQIFTKEQLYENVWGYDYAPDAKKSFFIHSQVEKENRASPRQSTIYSNLSLIHI